MTELPVALADWMDDHGLPGGPISEVTPLGGGTQNVMVRFRRGGREYVFRRPPLHPRPKSNDVIRREMRVLAALAATPVPAPRLVVGCPDEGVLGNAVFYLMEPVDGFNASVAVPDRYVRGAGLRHGMGRAAVQAAASLGAVDHVAVGLADFGEPDGFLERQVPRWLSELDSYSTLAGYPGPDIPGCGEVATWLAANRPSIWTPGIMHGDFHLANLMFAHDGVRIAAIVDWEMCTIGDPLLDLGWLLATWPSNDRADAIAGQIGVVGGLATPGELVDWYAERSGRDVSAIDWYTVLACFKLGILLEGTYARACAGKAPRATGDMLHGITLDLFARAQRLMT